MGLGKYFLKNKIGQILLGSCLFKSKTYTLDTHVILFSMSIHQFRKLIIHFAKHAHYKLQYDSAIWFS